MSNPSRVSKGVPTGGQFAASARDEADVSLTGGASGYTWSSNPDHVPPPKAAQALADVAAEHGMKVETEQNNQSASVTITNGDDSVTVVWSKTTVYEEALSAERLGFRTRGGKEAVRFDYATGRIRNQYPTIRSVRQARLWMSLPEK